ncbi:hypothetical protein PTSG_04053 [Salpingoeca rosetta]|uniref:FACT complex subunit SSRP1 n=1 Tax=Salpingoeca rosetta (strain ATCC 50818 / BSB-021) TaxID=946362 RepID=F2U7M9_SALR5|nr:uncharacterized protein PTSG_04053 [Salpingoeca rosetta]EGD83446.1 hypothetical protein PTSG_04053 [Salpingoeca rosetta]|eukprot:XP_004994950.1 hypothetical protein PTSG_04053 [Salpingoeca rosetta]
MADEKLIVETPVFMIVRGASCRGRMRCSPQGLAFKREATDKTQTFYKSDMASCETKRVARGHQLRIKLKSGGHATFEGFKSNDMNAMIDFFKKHYDLDIKIVELSLKGNNSGSARFHGNFLVFDVDGKPAFEVPLNAVGNVTSQKYEASIDFIQDEDADDNEQRVESMRFLVIPDPESEQYAKTEEFVENVKARASIAEYTSRAICTIGKLSFLVPRGRFDVELYPSFMQLRGSTYDHRLFYDYISHIYLLPRPDDGEYIVLAVDPPLRHGQTRYPHVLLQFTREHEGADVVVNVTSDEVRSSLSYLTESIPADQAEVTETGPLASILSRLLKALTKRKIITPGSFTSSEGFAAVNCTYKANRGTLYPLDRGFLFLHKPLLHISIVRNLRVTFDRVKESSSRDTKSFDMRLLHPERGEFEFRGLGQDELQPLIDFLRLKRVAIEGLDEAPAAAGDDDGFDSSEDEDHVVRPGDFDDGSSESDHSFAEDDVEESSMDSEEDEQLQDELVEDDMLGQAPAKKKRASKSRQSKQRDDDEEDDDDDEDEDEDEDEDDIIVEDKPVKSKKKTQKASAAKRGPKKAKTAYALWSSSARSKLKEQHPDLSFGELSKKLGQAWQDLADEDKAEWNEKAKEDRQRYLKEKKKFDAENPDAAKPAKKMRKKKDPNAPKGAKSAYIYFSTEMREKIKEEKPDLTLGQISQECGTLWRGLSDEEKKKYEKMAAEDKKRYEAEMAEYKAKNDADDDGDGDGDNAGSKKRSAKGTKSKAKKSKTSKAPAKGQSTLKFKSDEVVLSSESDDE